MKPTNGKTGYTRADDGSGIAVEVVCVDGKWVLSSDPTTVISAGRVVGTLAEVVDRKPRKSRKARVTGSTHAARTAPKD